MAQPKNSSYTRSISNLIILTLALISLILLRIQQNIFWTYTALMSVIVALLCVGTRVYYYFKNKEEQKRTIWPQILYWIGALGAVYITALMIHYGVTTKVQSGLFSLLILAVVLYLIGISEDLPLALVGITLALMVTGTIIIRPYFLLVIIPVTVIMGTLIVILIKKRKNI